MAQHGNTSLVQGSSIKGDQQKTEMVDLDSTRNSEFEQANGNKNTSTNNETRNEELEWVDGNEEVDTDDSGTFTVSSSTTLFHELSSQHNIELDTTLQAAASTSNNLPSSQPPPAVQAHAELHQLPSAPVHSSTQSMDNSSSGVQACPEPIQLPRASVNASSAVEIQRPDEQAVASIVRTEMKEILELQQQNLMALLKVVEAKAAQKDTSIDCGTQKDFDEEVHVDSGQLSTMPHDKGPVSHDVHMQEKSSELIMPVRFVL